MGEGLLKGAASTFAKAQVALAKVVITYPGWRRPLKVAGCLAAVTVVSFLYSHFEQTVEQLKNEHNVRVADLKSGLTMIAKFMEFEQRYFRSDLPPVQSSALVTLADLFMHRLNEVGPMSREELVDLAVKDGFFADSETAAQAVHPMLVTLVRSELIGELPNGTFAPPTMSQAIKLRRVV